MIVVDASVAFKWFSEKEAGFAQAFSLLEAHLSKTNPILVPDLLFYELANAWTTKTVLPITHITQNLILLEQYQLHIERLTAKQIQQACRLAKTHHTSVYDASYAVLAKEHNCNLITADQKFAKAIKLPFVTLLDSK